MTAETFLLVDDEEDVREVLALMLSQAGYCVLQAAGASEALRHVGEADLLLTDVTLNDGNGVDLAAAQPVLPVLFMSGGAPREGMEAATFLEKPFSPEKLLSKVQEALSS